MMERVLRAVLAGLSAAAILAFIILVGARIGHPFVLDPWEGAWLDQAIRIAHGQPLYVAPSLAYVALPENPGFPVAGAWLVLWFGPQLWALRLFAVLATLTTAWLALRVVRLETESVALGMASAGLLLAGFAAGGARFDVARPEALAWMLALAGLAALRAGEGARGALAAGLLLSLAFWTAHLAAVFLGAASIHLALSDRRRLLPFAAMVVPLVGGGAMLLARVLGPWFVFHAWDQVLAGFDPRRVAAAANLSRALMGTIAPLALAVLLSAALPTPLWRGRSALWVWAAVAGVGATLLGALGPEATAPGPGPAWIALSIAGPIALCRVVNHLAAWPGSERPGRSWALQAFLVLQFLPLTVGFRALLPDPRSRQAHDALVDRMRALPDSLLAPGYGFIAQQAGKGPAFDPRALATLLEARRGRMSKNDPGFAERFWAPLERGSDRPLLLVDRPLEGSPGASGVPWSRLASDYRRSAEWPELAGAPVPRFLYTPIPVQNPAQTMSSPSMPAGTTLVGSLEGATDTTHR